MVDMDACTCGPADPAMMCDAKYGKMWAMDKDGVDCPMTDGAMNLLASAALAIGTVLLF
jgi:hypothetical protein